MHGAAWYSCCPLESLNLGVNNIKRLLVVFFSEDHM